MVLFRIALLVGLIWLLWKGYRMLQAPTENTASPDINSAPDAAPTVACAACGLILPADSAVTCDGKSYCEDHVPPA